MASRSVHTIAPSKSTAMRSSEDSISFLDLPAEIRSEIYCLYLDSVSGTFRHAVYWQNLTRLYKPLTQSCRQIRNETSSMLHTYLGNLELAVGINPDTLPRLKHFLSTLPEAAVGKLRSLCLEFPNRCEESPKNDLSQVILLAYNKETSAFDFLGCVGGARWVDGGLSNDAHAVTLFDKSESPTHSPGKRAFLKSLALIPQVWDNLPHECKSCKTWRRGLPMFVEPVIEGWKGPTFTKEGLLRLLKVLGILLEGTARVRESCHKPDRLTAQKEAKSIGEDSANSYYEEDLMSRSHDTSLIVKLPIKRPGFQAFPWGATVKYEYKAHGRT